MPAVIEPRSLPSLLVIVFHLDDDPYREIKSAQMDTCFSPRLVAAQSRLGIRIAYASSGPLSPAWRRLDRLVERLRWSGGWQEGGHVFFAPLVASVTWPLQSWLPEVVIRDDADTSVAEWYVGIVPMLALGRWRLLAMFRESLRQPYDYLYITTTSSYAMPSRVQRWLLENEGTRAAGSPISIPRLGHSIPSGANRVFRRDIVERAVLRRKDLPRGVLDDVSLGIWLQREGVEVRSLPTLNLSSEDEVDALSEDSIHRAVHIRLKSLHDGGRNDARLMRRVHRIFGTNLSDEMGGVVFRGDREQSDE